MQHLIRFSCLLLLFLGNPAIAKTDYLEYFERQPAISVNRLSRTFETVLANVDRGNHARAAELMDDLLDSRGAAQLASLTRARLKGNAGLLYAASGDPVKARALIEEGIAIIDESVGVYDLALADLLVPLALLLQDNGAYEEAEEALRRAQHIVHRQDGVYSRRQLPLLERLYYIHEARGHPFEADREQRFNLKISEQAYGENSEALVPVLERLGEHFANRGNLIPADVARMANLPFEAHEIIARYHGSEREAASRYRFAMFRESVESYERAISIIENKYGPNDLRLTEPLKGLARARLLQRTANARAEEAMERRVQIVKDSPSSDIGDTARAMVDLADIYTITGDHRAPEVYREVWNLLSNDPELLDLRTELLGSPVRLFPPQVVLSVDRQPEGTEVGDPLYADIELTVDHDGEVSDVELVDTNVPRDNFRLLRRYLREEVVYRPRMADGEVVDTSGLMLHQSYEYVPIVPVREASFSVGP